MFPNVIVDHLIRLENVLFLVCCFVRSNRSGGARKVVFVSLFYGFTTKRCYPSCYIFWRIIIYCIVPCALFQFPISDSSYNITCLYINRVIYLGTYLVHPIRKLLSNFQLVEAFSRSGIGADYNGKLRLCYNETSHYEIAEMVLFTMSGFSKTNHPPTSQIKAGRPLDHHTARLFAVIIWRLALSGNIWRWTPSGIPSETISRAVCGCFRTTLHTVHGRRTANGTTPEIPDTESDLWAVNDSRISIRACSGALMFCG